MLLALTAATAAAPAQTPSSARARVQATATIRIVQAVRFRVGADRSMEGAAVRDGSVRDSDGRRQPAKLVELE
ncbi:hypothetical protein G7077_07235 [Sphingomonas piscis]|uniref:Uncharacterized protein n=1 Tax=Sphingomonas piscis TaxID=2714943 RepID=A0A6G7YPP4_9SPHN|nr:hypothetical protein [Sphingomonas piscis]QIK78718.1 hypothetical protein G7077_07235 [Sphingomonas piscis]